MLGLVLAGLGCMCMGNPPRKRRRTTRRNPGELISGPKRVGDKLLNWHGGGGSGLYAVGSNWSSGHAANAEDVRDAWIELVKLNRQATVDPKSGGWSAKDVRELGALVRFFNKKLAHRGTNPRRRNPLEAYHFYFSTHPSLIHGKRISWTRYGMSAEQVKRLGIAAAKNDYPKACDFAVAKIRKGLVPGDPQGRNPRKKKRR